MSRIFIASLLVVSLAGCKQRETLSEAYIEYVQFLEDGAPSEKAFKPKRVSLPPPKMSRVAEPDVRMTLGDVVSWSDCKWDGLLFERTGGLGKVMPSTRRWAHGTQLVNALERCATQQGDDEDAVAKLRGFAESKRTANASAWWNMLWGSPEWQSFLLTHARSFQLEELMKGEGLAALDHMDELLAWQVTGNYDLDIGRLEHALGILRRSRLGYKWLQGATMSYHALEWIRLRHLDTVAEKPSNDRCQELNRAFHKFFLRGVLKPTTAMVQVGQRLDAQSAAFVKRSVVDPTVWAGLSPQARAFISSRGWAPEAPEGSQMSARISEAIRQHVQAWTKVSKICGFTLALE